MPGIKGMRHARPKPGAVRNKVWQSMRILRRFTIPDLCRTSGAGRENVRKFIKRLETHGYVEQQGNYVSGRPGVYRGMRLVKDIGPFYPTRCDICGRPLKHPCTSKQEEPSHEDKKLD